MYTPVMVPMWLMLIGALVWFACATYAAVGIEQVLQKQGPLQIFSIVWVWVLSITAGPIALIATCILLMIELDSK